MTLHDVGFAIIALMLATALGLGSGIVLVIAGIAVLIIACAYLIQTKVFRGYVFGMIAPNYFVAEEPVLVDTSVELVSNGAMASHVAPEALDEEPEPLYKGPKYGDKFVIPFGTIEGTDIDLYQELSHMGHTFVMGATRYGKTVKIHEIVKYLIENHSPDELQLGFSDAKKVSYNIYKKLPHTRWPIACSKKETLWLLEEVKQLMYNRISMFAQFEDRMCENVTDYFELTGKSLPKVVIIFDELADSIAKESDAEEVLTTIAKMGLATGIFLILATQRPTREAITHEVQSQCITRLCTYMTKDSEYKFSAAPKSLWSKMNADKGRFMTYSPELAPLFLSLFPENGGWGIVQGGYNSNRVIEKSVMNAILKNGSKVPETWSDWGYTEEDEEMEYEWGRTHFEKIRAISMLGRELGAYPTKDEVAKRFNITAPTAQRWLERTY